MTLLLVHFRVACLPGVTPMKQMNFFFKWWLVYEYTAVINFHCKKSDFAGRTLLGSMLSSPPNPPWSEWISLKPAQWHQHVDAGDPAGDCQDGHNPQEGVQSNQPEACSGRSQGWYTCTCQRCQIPGNTNSSLSGVKLSSSFHPLSGCPRSTLLF